MLYAGQLKTNVVSVGPRTERRSATDKAPGVCQYARVMLTSLYHVVRGIWCAPNIRQTLEYLVCDGKVASDLTDIETSMDLWMRCDPSMFVSYGPGTPHHLPEWELTVSDCQKYIRIWNLSQVPFGAKSD